MYKAVCVSHALTQGHTTHMMVTAWITEPEDHHHPNPPKGQELQATQEWHKRKKHHDSMWDNKPQDSR